MSRSNWYQLAAIVGLALALLIAAQLYQFYQAAEQQQATYKYQPARQPGFRIDGATKAPTQAHKPSCNNPNSSEDADLCAQWAAVDQVTESNRLASLNLRLTVLSFFSTIVATVFLIWTFLETRKTSRRELRAYVSVELGYLRQFTQKNGSREIVLELEKTNGGATPAYKCVHLGNIVVLPPDQAQQYFTSGWRNAPRLGDAVFGVIHNGQTKSGEIRSHEAIPLAKLNEIEAGFSSLFAFGSVEYEDTFGDAHVTRFCHVITPEIWRTADRIARANPGEPKGIEWELAPFHNEAT